MTEGEVAATTYNDRIEALREHEYPSLKDEVYLDHAGTTLFAKSLMDRFAIDMTAHIYGNPHSASPSSQLSSSRIEDTRLRVMQFFNADPSDFDLVFVANATAGVKLVVEAFRGSPEGFTYAYHQACHTSLVGVRQEARNSLCLDDAAVERWVAGSNTAVELRDCPSPILFAFPAQSNMNGQKLPMDWSNNIRARYGSSSEYVYTLLDAAAYAATSPVDLGNSESAPDFTVVSFNKIFGFPDLGGLLIRRQAASVFRNRRYFGGGTVDLVVSGKEQWHALKTQTLHDALEDGTLPIHSIIALEIGIDVHKQIFTSMKAVSAHTSYLFQELRTQLLALRHGNGLPVCTIYTHDEDRRKGFSGNGPVVAFNLQNHMGVWISLTEFEKLAALKKFHVRTGGLCNPGGIAAALKLEPWEMKRNFSAGFRCGNENDVICGKPTGVIRVSLGAMSTMSDVDKFIAFVDEFFRTDDVPVPLPISRSTANDGAPSLHVADMMVYPIKSCGGFRIPKGVSWNIRPEGLAWDREWCLIHQGTGQVLSQKRHPRMTLLRPTIDFAKGVLDICYHAPKPERPFMHISISLSEDPTLLEPSPTFKQVASRVCGEEITTRKYTSAAINEFFSLILEVPCVLARFPPGGHGNSMRHAKAHLQKHQTIVQNPIHLLPGTFPGDPTTPPDSDSEGEQRQRILLSNESPILAINLSSLQALNDSITARGGKPVSAETFRANIVIGLATSSSSPSSSPVAAAQPDSLAYAEDHWSTLRIGTQEFRMLGSCRRCHMVCIDQETAARSEEPFVTLAKTRRFDGKVFFGTHMCHVRSVPLSSQGSGGVAAVERMMETVRRPTIQVGDEVVVDPGR